MREKPNRLQGAVSPYLLQHAANPVDWFPWGSEAFDAAKAGNKPVFLSIGYSACHWCHVMAHECFEDEEVASLMNDAFISVKVDREELPHVDHAYMRVCQMMTGSGGWPLTIVMTPEKEPFFAATFLPKHTGNGLLGMMDLVPLLMDAWNTKRGKVSDLARRVSQAAAEYSPSSDGNPEKSWLKSAYESLATRFQNDTGGFTSTPKFPTPHHLMFLLRYFYRTGEEHALHMVEKTLDSMRRGGIYDHLGKGFHRYATDPLWRVPHFEKMLYDQALLAMAYTEAYLVTSREAYSKTAMQTLDYVLRDLRPDGILFASAQDADVSGEEGGYYLWTVGELRSLLKDDDYRLLSETFAIEASGNFPEAHGQGSNILFMRPSALEAGPDVDRILAILHAERGKREPPQTDDKALTDWNGLMIAALAKADFAFGERRYIDAARAAADFILKNMHDGNGRLLHVYRQGTSAHRAGLDDYAFLIWGLIELYEVTFENTYFHEAFSLMHECISLFWDEKQSGFFLTPEDSEVIIARMKDFADNAMPSGNSVAVHDLVRLSRLTGEASFEEKAMTAVKACSGQIEAMPDAATFLMTGLDLALSPSCEIVIAGSPDAADTRSLLDVLASRFLPESVMAFTRGEEDKASPAITRGKSPVKGKAAAYVCRGLTCIEPATDPADLARLLSF